MEATRGKEEERGKIPSFQTVNLTNMEKVRMDQIGKGHIFIADMGGKYIEANKYNLCYNITNVAAEIKKTLFKKT